MTLSVVQLFAASQMPTGAAGVIYEMPTTPAASVLKNGRLRLTNTTAAPVTVSLHADVAANASGAANAFLDNYSLGAHTAQDFDIPTLKAGDTLRGLASGAGVTVHEMGGALYS
jgi:hypothetical protein